MKSAAKKDAQRLPFEKVKFHSDVKGILARSAQEGTDFYCKTESDPMFGFKPESYSEKWGLFGQVVPFENETELPKFSDAVVVNFQVGGEKFFCTAEFRPMKTNGVLRMIGSLYKLERRGHLRVPMREALQKDANIISRDGHAAFHTCEILNMSQGGMRIRFPLDTKAAPLKKDEVVRFGLHINNHWRMEVEGVVKHSQSDEDNNFCGIEFKFSSDGEHRKIISLMLELQRRYFTTDHV